MHVRNHQIWLPKYKGDCKSPLKPKKFINFYLEILMPRWSFSFACLTCVSYSFASSLIFFFFWLMERSRFIVTFISLWLLTCCNWQAIVFNIEQYKGLNVPLPAVVQVSQELWGLLIKIGKAFLYCSSLVRFVLVLLKFLLSCIYIVVCVLCTSIYKVVSWWFTTY